MLLGKARAAPLLTRCDEISSSEEIRECFKILSVPEMPLRVIKMFHESFEITQQSSFVAGLSL